MNWFNKYLIHSTVGFAAGASFAGLACLFLVTFLPFTLPTIGLALSSMPWLLYKAIQVLSFAYSYPVAGKNILKLLGIVLA